MTVDDMLELARAVEGWMSDDELAWLFGRAARVPPGGRWVEVGVWKGRSAVAVACGLPPGCRLALADHFRGSPSELATGHKQAAEPGLPVFREFAATLAGIVSRRPDLAVEVYVADSAVAAAGLGPASCDAVFIDGDHEAAAVARDLEAWARCLVPGGLLAGHDYNYPGVRAALEGVAVTTGPGSIWVREGGP